MKKLLLSSLFLCLTSCCFMPAMAYESPDCVGKSYRIETGKL